MTVQQYIANTNGWNTLDLHSAMRLLRTLRNDPTWISSRFSEPCPRGKRWLDRIFNRLQEEDSKRLLIGMRGYA